MIAFPGAAAASLAGLPVALGYFGFCGARRARARRDRRLAAGSLSARVGRDRHRCRRSRSALGFLFVSLYHGVLNGLDSLLFGTFLGITSRPGARAARRRGRPRSRSSPSPRGRCFFASVDADVARAARRAGAGLLGFGFLLVLGLAVAETSQITGALLVFALLVTPAATAQQLTARPGARPRALGRDRARRHLARAGARVLLDLPGRLLRHLALLRALRLVRVGRAVARPPGARRAASRASLMFAHEFMRNALARRHLRRRWPAALVGYFVVLRAQVFAGDALSHVAFTGALAAAVARASTSALGLFAATIARRRRDGRRSATAPGPTTS